jgi:uncharacterized protein
VNIEKEGITMRDYNTASTPQEPARVGPAAVDAANPAPLGLNILAFATAVLGCFYAGFIIPYQGSSVRPVVGAVLFIAGVVLIIAGILEYRKNSMLSATVFTSYGGLLAAIGLIFVPIFGSLSFLLSSSDMHLAMGLLFLCWTIFNAILFLGTLRLYPLFAATMFILFLAYLLLTIGQLVSNSSVINHIGGWLAIIAALAAWLTGFVSLLGSEGPDAPFQLPVVGRRAALVE